MEREKKVLKRVWKKEGAEWNYGDCGRRGKEGKRGQRLLAQI